MEVTYFYDTNYMRAKSLAAHLRRGAQKVSAVWREQRADAFVQPHSEVAMFYGQSRNHLRVYNAYRERGLSTVLFDLGYWKRMDHRHAEGRYRVAINCLHESNYIAEARNNDERYRACEYHVPLLKENVRPIKRVLLAGMSAKAALVYGLAPEEWERSAVEQIKTQLPEAVVVYRPKPTFRQASFLPGTLHEPSLLPSHHAVRRYDCVVTHHSTIALEAIMQGIPAFTFSDCPAYSLSSHDWNDLRNPWVPDREAVKAALNNLAWCQWAAFEMNTLKFWSYIQNRLQRAA